MAVVNGRDSGQERVGGGAGEEPARLVGGEGSRRDRGREGAPQAEAGHRERVARHAQQRGEHGRGEARPSARRPSPRGVATQAPSTPRPSAVASTDWWSTPARPSSSGWTSATSGCTRSRPWRARSAPWKNGDTAASGWTAEHTSCTKPGSVSAALRVPPPIVSAPSSTSTERPAAAHVMAAASPFGPEPTTTTSTTPSPYGVAMGVTIDEILVGDPREAWEAAGFSVDDDGTCRIGTVRVRLVGRDGGKRILGWSLRDAPPARLADGLLDGLPTTGSEADPAERRPSTANGATHIDHVVLLSPDLARTTAALGALGVEPRGERDTDTYGAPMRQVFFRLGEVILELVGQPDTTGEGDPGFFGLAITVADLDAVAGQLGDHLGSVKDAVQEGRRIATLRHRDLGMSVATALMSPEPGAERAAQTGRRSGAARSTRLRAGAQHRAAAPAGDRQHVAAGRVEGTERPLAAELAAAADGAVGEGHGVIVPDHEQ